MLFKLIATTTLSFASIASLMNEEFGTTYSRNAILGRAYRMKQCTTMPQHSPETREERKRAAQIRKNENKKIKRRIEKPWLADRAPRINRAEERRRVRAMFEASGTSRTSSLYRKHLPKLPEMSKSELRGMLADAMRNTAAMGVS